MLWAIMANFVLKFSHFCCHGNRGRSDVNFNDTSKLPTSKTPCLVQHLWLYFLYCRVLAIFPLKFPHFRCHGNQGRSDENSNDAGKLLDLENPLFGAIFVALFLELAEFFRKNSQIFVAMETRVGLT